MKPRPGKPLPFEEVLRLRTHPLPLRRWRELPPGAKDELAKALSSVKRIPLIDKAVQLAVGEVNPTLSEEFDWTAPAAIRKLRSGTARHLEEILLGHRRSKHISREVRLPRRKAAPDSTEAILEACLKEQFATLLSPLEHAVLRAADLGMTAEEAADRLGVSRRTVYDATARMKKKFRTMS
jgi:DNA-binding CsgD family transcriptional regulator